MACSHGYCGIWSTGHLESDRRRSTNSGKGIIEMQRWTSIIKPRTGWFDINLKELWQYRDLVKMFVKKDVVTYYKQTVLGPTWFILNPLLTTTVFTVIFGLIAHISTDGIPGFLFYMLGNTVWILFSTCVTNTSNTFIRNSGMMGKVYFPRLTVPIATVLFAVISFFVQFGVFILLWFYYWITGAVQPNWFVLFTPVLLLHESILGLGCGIIISSLTTKYRDLQMLVTFGITLWMYLSPVVYSVTSIPENLRVLYMLNPMAPILEMYRFAFFGVGTVSVGYYICSFVMSMLILSVGIVLFSRIEKTFADTV